MGAAAPLRRVDLEAALGRLRGQLVATPVIGGLDLPGFAVPPDLRLKAEVLQPSGSLWFRGAMHWAMRQMGRRKGVMVNGPPRAMRALACAAREARLAAHAAPLAPLSPELHTVLAYFGCTVGGPAGGEGFAPSPGPDAPEFALGVASIVLELTEELPRDTRALFVAPALLADVVAAGVTALGVPWQVVAGAAQHARAAELQALLLEHHRLGCDPEGAATLAAAIEHGASGTCVLLGV